MSVDSSTDVKQNDIKDLEELDRQNAQFDQSNDTDEIAIVARLAADGAERWISVMTRAILIVWSFKRFRRWHIFDLS